LNIFDHNPYSSLIYIWYEECDIYILLVVRLINANNKTTPLIQVYYIVIQLSPYVLHTKGVVNFKVLLTL